MGTSRFGIGIRDSNRPQFASGYLLLSLALAHGALFQVSTVDDLAQFDLSNGEIPLRWKTEYLENDICTRAQMLVMPEVARIATAMSCTKELSFDEKLLFVQDLQTRCTRDFDVVYLPNESLIQGVCPAKGCQINIGR